MYAETVRETLNVDPASKVFSPFRSKTRIAALRRMNVGRIAVDESTTFNPRGKEAENVTEMYP